MAASSSSSVSSSFVPCSSSSSSSSSTTTTTPIYYPFMQWVDIQHQDQGQLKALRHFANNVCLGQWEVARAMLRSMPHALLAQLLPGIIAQPEAVAR